MNYTLNIRGRLLELAEPQVMGIVNVTPDSFHADSRAETPSAIAQKVEAMVGAGATLIDVGACSTRPGSTPATEREELERLSMALPVVRSAAPHVALSVDTFRPSVARMAVEEWGADLVNDVGEVQADRSDMFRMVARLGVPYVLTSHAADMAGMLMGLARDVQQLRDMGQKDIIIDPGFGFGKTLEQNFAVMRDLEQLSLLELPVLVGVSRKRMVWQLLGSSPASALNGTTALNMMALERGALILRVHDVQEAAECVRLWKAVREEC